MRALLIVNPHATSTTRLRRDVIASALASAVELDVVETRYSGHATRLAAAAAADGYRLVLTFGGDGTVNEAVNGLLTPDQDSDRAGPGAGRRAEDSRQPGDTASQAGNDSDVISQPALDGDAADRPALAALPGGNANVFCRALGLPPDPVDAAGQILRALAEGRQRSIGLGLAGSRYFTFNAGLGLDAEVVRAVQGWRARGRAVTPALYVRMTLRQYYRITDRRHPALTMELDGRPPEGPLFLGLVSNTAPWTYLGKRAVQPSPKAGFESGLDVFALRSLHTAATLRTVRQMLSGSGRAPRGSSVLALHDVAELTLRSQRPVAFQVDGEYVGEAETVRFRSVPRAVRVIS